MAKVTRAEALATACQLIKNTVYTPRTIYAEVLTVLEEMWEEETGEKLTA